MKQLFPKFKYYAKPTTMWPRICYSITRYIQPLLLLLVVDNCRLSIDDDRRVGHVK